MATAIRPYGFFGKPLLPSGLISVQVLPPSVERNSPLAEGAVGLSPPERYSHPLRRKSHRLANIMFGFVGSTAISVQPVERFGPLRICVHVLPPSKVLYRPRSAQRAPSHPNLRDSMSRRRRWICKFHFRLKHCCASRTRPLRPKHSL